MKPLLRAVLIAAALSAVAPLTAPAAHAEGAWEHNQPGPSPYAYRHHRDHDRDWRRDHNRNRDRYSHRRDRDDDHRHGHRRHRNDAEDRFWRLFH